MIFTLQHIRELYKYGSKLSKENLMFYGYDTDMIQIQYKVIWQCLIVLVIYFTDENIMTENEEEKRRMEEKSAKVRQLIGK